MRTFQIRQLSTGAYVSVLLLCHRSPRFDDLGPARLGVLSKCDGRRVVLVGLIRVAGLRGGPRRTDRCAEPMRLFPERCLECSEGFPRLAMLEQHRSIKFACRSWDARSYRMFFSLVLCIGCSTHRLESFLVLALRRENPSGCDLLLDVDLLGPIVVLGLTQFLAQFSELRQFGFGRLRFT